MLPHGLSEPDTSTGVSCLAAEEQDCSSVGLGSGVVAKGKHAAGRPGCSDRPLSRFAPKSLVAGKLHRQPAGCFSQPGSLTWGSRKDQKKHKKGRRSQGYSCSIQQHPPCRGVPQLHLSSSVLTSCPHIWSSDASMLQACFRSPQASMQILTAMQPQTGACLHSSPWRRVWSRKPACKAHADGHGASGRVRLSQLSPVQAGPGAAGQAVRSPQGDLPPHPVEGDHAPALPHPGCGTLCGML